MHPTSDANGIMHAEIEIVEKSLDRLSDYGQIPIRFEVRSVFEIEGEDPGSAANCSLQPPNGPEVGTAEN